MAFARHLGALLILAFVLALPAHAQSTYTTKITFVLVNDIYQMGGQRMADGQIRGGFARLAAVVAAERAKGGHVVFAHAGDTISPSLMSGFDRGAHIIALTNLIAPDVFVPGNHEFDFGKATFLQRMAEATFPLYGANLRGPDGQPLPGFKDRSIVTFDGVRIGITGAAADDSPHQSSPEDLKFAGTVETMKAQSAALRREGADFVVGVIHAHRQQDRELYRAGIFDLILTGDDHDLYVNFNGRTAIVESSSDAQYVTAIDVTITVTEQEGQRTVLWWPQFRIIDTATVTPDPRIAAEVAKFEQQMSKELDVQVGVSAVELDSRLATVRTREAAIGNLFADAMRAATGADAAVTNGGGIRGDKLYRPGTPITRRDVLTELPFGNTVVLLEITGRDLKAALETGVARLPAPSGPFPQVSGMSIEIDPKRPVGARIVAMTIAGVPLDENKLYKIATNDYLARGGDDYSQFRDAKHLIRDYDGPLMANEVMAFIRKLGEVSTRVEGRIVVR